MDFFNETQFPATIARVDLTYKDLIMATTIVKCTFTVEKGLCVPTEEQIEILEKDTETPYGHIDADAVPIKAGCDFAIYGSAIAPASEHPVRAMKVETRIGDFSRSLLIYGNRVWQKRITGFVASRPEPFQQMPITYQHAYGGNAMHDVKNNQFPKSVNSPYPDNPLGRGYVVQKHLVEGTALPNIEEYDSPIRSWQDQPMPGGFAALHRTSMLRAKRGYNVDIEKSTVQMAPSAFLFSHPKMHLPGYPAGQHVQVFGMTPGGMWKFVLPKISLSLKISLGERMYRLPLVSDTLCLLPDENQFYVVGRRAVVYQFRPERKRSITVVHRNADETPVGATTTIGKERVKEDPWILIEDENLADCPLPLAELSDNNPIREIVEDLPLLVSE